jgi:hypothetical protein
MMMLPFISGAEGQQISTALVVAAEVETLPLYDPKMVSIMMMMVVMMMAMMIIASTVCYRSGFKRGLRKAVEPREGDDWWTLIPRQALTTRHGQRVHWMENCYGVTNVNNFVVWEICHFCEQAYRARLRRWRTRVEGEIIDRFADANPQ